ncbi:2Fe-2S iron-sulfur cluster-binding protein [Nocardia brevicatena]|uniref:2Fe-2S iron-sulfur cluster-binding protein n=1 Tax=Nocardia brevicatena TaxID=37327 RepID=UPI0002ED56E8|nr:2Fe-2S iron-sulfur cluster-binding protein [Nocardia brevicatena]
MVKVTFLIDGSPTTLDADDGDSVMMTSVQNGLDGIIGECGGSLSCATCHVYVGKAWVDKVGEPTDDENELLEGAVSPRRSSSRLSCRIELCDELDGLTVEVPPEQ